jgi:hypothetical protein
MAEQVVYVADEGTARVTPEAFRIRLEQSRFRVRSVRAEGDEVEIDTDAGVVLSLFVENGYVAEIEGEVTFVNDRRSGLLLQLIESMGFVPAEA